MIKFSAPGKIHLLGEHAVVYGKPALLTAIDLRVYVTISKTHSKTVIPAKAGIQLTNSAKWIPAYAGMTEKIQKIIEPIVKKRFKLKKLPAYQLKIESQLPIGSGLGSSAAVSAAYIAALLSYLRSQNVILNSFQDLKEMPKQVRHDDILNLELINELTYEAEKVFHGNPSGGDNSTVVYGGLIWFSKEAPDSKIIQPLPFTIPPKLAKNFVLINTGTPKESTKDIVTHVKQLYNQNPKLVEEFLEDQEKLVKELLNIIKAGNEVEMIRIIRAGERNLESIDVCSPYVKKIIRQIEKLGGAAKICGAGGKTGPTGVLLCYHPQRQRLQIIAKEHELPFFTATLGVEGLREEG